MLNSDEGEHTEYRDNELKAVSLLTSLQTLDLSKNKLKFSHFKFLLSSMQDLSSLFHLDLNNIKIVDKAQMHYVLMHCDGLRHREENTAFYNEFSTAICSFLKNNKNLISLNLSGLSDKDNFQIMTFDIGTSCYEALQSNPRSTLEDFKIDCEPYTTSGAKKFINTISSLLRNNSSLTSLDITNHDMNSADASPIFAALTPSASSGLNSISSGNVNLKKLSVEWDKYREITENEFKALASMIRYNDSLQTLTFKTEQPTKRFFFEITMKIMELQKVCLRGLSYMKSSSLKEFRINEEDLFSCDKKYYPSDEKEKQNAANKLRILGLFGVRDSFKKANSEHVFVNSIYSLLPTINALAQSELPAVTEEFIPKPGKVK